MSGEDLFDFIFDMIKMYIYLYVFGITGQIWLVAIVGYLKLH